MPLKETKAILLRAIPYLEYNAVLKTFSSFGMIDFMSYGIKKHQPHLLNPGTILSIKFYDSAKTSLYSIKDINCLVKFNYLLEDIDGMIFLGEIVRTISIVGKEAQPNKEFDNLITYPLKKIDKTQNIVWLTIPWLIVHLLRLSGLLNVDMFSIESKEIIYFLAQHQFDDIIESKITACWQEREKVSDIVILIANYYKDYLGNRTIATELLKAANRLLRY